MEKFVDFVGEEQPLPQQKPVAKQRALSKIGRFLTNKFFIASAIFVVVMVFLDKNDLITSMDRRKELKELESSKDYYTRELSELQKIKKNLQTEPAMIEKLAREKYLMKRANEDIFLTEDNAHREEAK